MSGQSALILGATGATGKHLLKELISSSHFTKIGEYGRRVTPQSQIPATNKLEQKVVDFETINRTAFQNDRWDVIFITYVQCSVSHLFLRTKTEPIPKARDHSWKRRKCSRV
ncbi:hypothetical protein PHLCEN_2v7472 [Hermanssonia centrifuga]|uniref:NAD(P)-binding domain-containing protein n=1 Tax=Hermanssonia centrifuga TaxID=98765 RepID=A0A2R6NWG6_9APHY|nr:hypothetical protein PHLCEN_2v7472 [Hermanssonia centrifuga]